MSLRAEIRQLPSDKTTLRKFGWTVGAAFLVLCFLLAVPLPHFLGKGGFYPVLLGIGGVLVVLGTLLPLVLKPIYFAWMSLALVLGAVMTRVILTLFFFVVLTPVGLFFRLIGRDPLHRRFDPKATTYWITKEYPIADRSRFEKYF